MLHKTYSAVTVLSSRETIARYSLSSNYKLLKLQLFSKNIIQNCVCRETLFFEIKTLSLFHFENGSCILLFETSIKCANLDVYNGNVLPIQVFWNDLKAIVMELPTAAGTAGILGLTFLNQCGAVVFKWGSRPGSATLYSRDGTEFMKHAQGTNALGCWRR
jgi:hypothetical protein